MSQHELVAAVAAVTGESVAVIRTRGFSVADPLEVNFDPEFRQAWVLDWDTMGPEEWPAA